MSPMSPALQVDSLLLSHRGSPKFSKLESFFFDYKIAQLVKNPPAMQETPV